MVPSAGATDWVIHSCGSSKLTFFAGSVKTFQADAVEPGSAEAEAVDPGEAAGVVLPADGSVEGAPLAPGLLPAVQAGVPLVSLLQPDSAAAASASAAVIRRPRAEVRRKVSVPVMVPA
jgi:hypothetical protein